MPTTPTPEPFPEAYNVAPNRCPTGVLRVGCVYDTQTTQQRWYHEIVPKEDREPMTPELCFDFCKNSSGAQYFGLKGGDDCYCTPFFHNTNKGGRGDCDMPCVGDQTRMCGGEQLVEVYEMHDCKNLPAYPCNRPPPMIEHAKLFNSSYYRHCPTPCANAVNKPLTTENSHCEIQCEEGYELASNDLVCVERGNPLVYAWGQIHGTAACRPISCGHPPEISHSKYDNAEVFYEDEVDYTCTPGFTTNGQALGPEKLNTKCGGTGEIEKPGECERVSCGECPTDGPFQNATAVQKGFDRVYEDWCNYTCQYGFTLDQQAAGPTTFTTQCMASAEFSQVTGCLPVSCGAVPKYPHATAGDPSISVVTYSQVVEYECKIGYTITGIAGGSVSFQRQCQADGMFSQEGKCKPVQCGNPPVVDKCTYLKAPLVFNQSVLYTCDIGYTLTGTAGDATETTLTCVAGGYFGVADGKGGFKKAKPPVCQPVECGTAPTVPQATLEGDTSAVQNFSSEPLTYRCESGYSTSKGDDPRKPVLDTFTVTCKANGKFSKASTCVNIDNCLVQSCLPHGKCADTDPPTGVAFDDYSCECDAGYEQKLVNSTIRKGTKDKTCSNINDCPVEKPCGGTSPHGCARGLCRDLVEGYSCSCAAGYKVAALPTLPANQTCTPVVCGKPPDVNHSSVDVDSEVPTVDYDVPPLNYTCSKGYSMDGTASGETKFQVTCRSVGTFSQPPPCKPVSCGTPEAVPHSTISPQCKEMVFPQQITYTCDYSYSVDGQSTGETEFTIACDAKGVASAVRECKPMECPNDNLRLSNARDLTGQAKYVFEETANIGCAVGYSTDGTANEAAKTYTATCEGDGEWSKGPSCIPVRCGFAKTVPHTTLSDTTSKVFPETVEYTLEVGYSLDGTPSGKTTFTVECRANGTFTPTEPVHPISCGPAPNITNADGPELVFVYNRKATYSCLHGYTLTGEATATKSFNLTCTADGKYEGPTECKPVDCGAVTAPSHSEQVPDGHGGMLTSLVYGTYATFQCNKGFSKVGTVHCGAVTGNVTCQPNGSLHYPAPCINNNDCDAPDNRCAPHGSCLDIKTPTGNHFDDFYCECNSGFEENATGGVRTCYNVDDCPKDACKPGSCQDGVNSYTCNCPTGYTAEPNEAKGLTEDCMPLPCGVPKPLPDASTEVANEVFYADPPVQYTCDEGFSLDGSAFGETGFSIACLSDGTFDKGPSCMAVYCGLAPHVDNADYPQGQPFFYPGATAYTCHKGYSIHGEYEAQSTIVKVACLANGSFSTPPTCHPVACPPVPEQLNTVVNHFGTELVYGESVTETCVVGHALDALKHTATSYHISCNWEASLEYSSAAVHTSTHTCVPISCGSPPPKRMRDVDGSEVFGGNLTLRCRTGWSFDRSPDPASQVRYATCPASGSWPELPSCLKISCGTPLTVPHATVNSGEELLFEDEVTYTLETGYSTTGTADGPTVFTVTCQANGTLTPASVPKPVSCGVTPDLPNATHASCSLVFPQEVTYTCSGGHTVTGHSTGEKTFKLECDEEGTYSGRRGRGGCKPIDCGAVRVPDNTVQIDFNNSGILSELVYPQKAYFRCVAGYSKTGKMAPPPLQVVHSMCLATGKITVHSGCINMDDCEGNVCGVHGTCVDNPKPTGVHLNDYHCDCDSGFKPNLTQDGRHTCGNIPDCPIGACAPGSCHDLINDYKCTCPEGYIEAPNEKKGLAHDCLPVSCGTPPAEQHATCGTSEEVFYDDEPLDYECESGYSLNGVYGGETTYTIECQADRTFSKGPKCEGVWCGKPAKVENAQVAETYLQFTQEATYTCDAGYFVNGSATTVTTFTGSCEFDGQIRGVKSCVPVPCPLPSGEEPFGPHCSFDEGLAGDLVYPENVTVTCLQGYALNKDEIHDTTYAVSCTSGGTIHVPAVACTPIDCGPLPEVEHGTASGSTLFGGSVTVTADAGYSLDGSASDAAKSFTTVCQSSGSWSCTHTFQKVKCGFAPLVKYTSRAVAPLHDTEKVFEDVVQYILSDGYTLDGTVEGPKEFEVTCLANGTFSPGKDPKPVLCGEPPAREHGATPPCSLTFNQTTVYTCGAGYTTDGTSSGSQTFSLRCAADGSFAGSGTCKPVKCGDITTPGNSAQIPNAHGESPGQLSFGEHATFECSDGFSKTGVLYSQETTFNITCRADGMLHQGGSCTNNDDCASPENQCSPNGVCIDNAKPTGTHAEDFHCECSSGFVQAPLSTDPSVQVCSNVDDCPATACLNGTCLDLVNDYTCNCSAGFYLGPNTAQGLDHDCLPVNCGTPPTVSRASTSAAHQAVHFGMDPVEYSCNTGYTLDSSPQCASTFSLECQADGWFETPPSCLRVYCGLNPGVDHATAWVDSKTALPGTVELYFGDDVSYSCESGYSLDGTAGGTDSFHVTCGADGALTGLTQQCLPVACPAPTRPDPFGPHATYDSQACGALVYPQTLEVKCEPGYARDKDEHDWTTYEISCLANGRHSTATSTCVPIDCGKAPEVPHGTVTGSTLFGGTLTATADEGYSIGGVVGVRYQSFQFSCGASGDFSAISVFVRVSCGVAPEITYSEVSLVEFAGAGLSLHAEPTAAPPRKGRGLSIRRIPSVFAHKKQGFAQKKQRAVKARRAGESPVASFRDTVKYVCIEGYYANNGGQTSEIELICEADGTYQVSVPEGLHNYSCVPAVCEIPERHGVSPCEASSATFTEGQTFECEAGFSLDGTPTGLTTFTETCGASGSFSVTNECTPIDWCLEAQCGAGHCENGEESYSCICDKGYEVEPTDGGETCVQIDECDTKGGSSFCGSSKTGYCTDGLLNYTCTCNTGYENVMTIDGYDSCVPVQCPDLPDRPHSHSRPSANTKMSFPQTAEYFCEAGYTFDGTPTGETEFQVECRADKSYSEFQDCVPVGCGSLRDKPNSVANVSSLTYSQVAMYVCNEGFKYGESATNFTVTCLKCGCITYGSKECTPVDCGAPPTVPHVLGLEQLVFGETLDAECEPGYTLDGTAAGGTSFTVGCSANRSYSGIKHCVPVQCGAPPVMDFTTVPALNQSYPDEFEALCENGYTLDEDPEGPISFMVKCAANGSFTGLHTCKPVTCGVPNSTSAATAPSTPAFFEDSVTWDCKPGYSVTGWKHGATQYTRTCNKNGDFSSPTPCVCHDIDYCKGNPCSANGICTDSGVGVPEPGYTCACHPGFEVKDTATGPRCSEDDCAGNPCGEGGTCTDLSKQTGQDGAYSCYCEIGYEEVFLALNSSIVTCRRKECPELPTSLANVVTVNGVPNVTVTTWDGRPYPSGSTGPVLLQAADSATYTCKAGYSTDGSAAADKKSVNVVCEMSGELSNIPCDTDCQRVRCENIDNLLRHIKADLLHPAATYFSSDVLEFHCGAGHTLDGNVGGASSFEVTCGNNGKFIKPTPIPVCQPVQCTVDMHSSAEASSVGLVSYGKVVTYVCSPGYEVSAGVKQYAGTCEADGTIHFASPARCVPVSCGHVDPQPNAELSICEPGHEEEISFHGIRLLGRAHEPLPQYVIPFNVGQVANFDTPPIQATCDPGFTVGGVEGGQENYEITCAEDGSFETTEGATCEEQLVSVAGEVTDSTSSSLKLSGVALKFTNEAGVVVATATTDSSGRYSVKLPEGKITITGTKSEYIEASGNFTVTGPISVGGAADLSLSKILSDGQLRVVLTWAEHSRDLDSWTKFGRNYGELVKWNNRDETDYSSGIEVSLDRDERYGFGPETTTFYGVGECELNCWIQFLVDNYTPTDADIGDSQAVIKVYVGDHVERTFTIPPSAGSARIVTIFTLDASTGQNGKIYEGDYAPPPPPVIPELQTYLYSQWWHSQFDQTGTVKLSSNRLLGGMKSSSWSGEVWYGKYYRVRDGGLECAEEDWSSLGGVDSWLECPEGQYLAGFKNILEHGDLASIFGGWCCKPQNLPNQWGSCTDVNTPVEWNCPVSTVVVGLYRTSSSKTMTAVEKAKCCEFASP